MINRITRIRVSGLFGLFTHDVTLDNKDRITILHGPNGYGKTTLLRMIAAFCSDPIDANVFASTVFSSFTVTFDDSSVATITKGTNKEEVSGLPVLKFRTAAGEVTEVALRPVPNEVLVEVDHSVPAPYRLRGGIWHVPGRIGTYGLGEIIKLFPQVASQVPKEFRPGVTSCPKVPAYFVQTERLEPPLKQQSDPASWARLPQFTEDDEVVQVTRSRVQQYSEDIVSQIKTVITNYAIVAQDRDRTFPTRLVESIRLNAPVRNAKELLAEMEQLEQHRRRLISLGLVDTEAGLPTLKEDDLGKVLAPLTIYLEDARQKLAIFSDLALRLGTLIDMLNARFKHKDVTVTRGGGFAIKSKNGEIIPLNALSSGEQHELVVNYDLIFRAPKDGLVLVDEPEISLHVGWQSRFLDDFRRILDLNSCYGIIATHAPTIIGSRWDLTKELNGLDGEV